MTDPLHLDARVHAQFREAFGVPEIAVGKDDQWALYATPNSCAIHVLLNGCASGVSLWVFDPHDRKNGVFNRTITSDDEVDGFIEQIRTRLARILDAARPNREIAPDGQHPRDPSGELQSEVRSQKSEVRSQKSEVRSQSSDAGSES